MYIYWKYSENDDWQDFPMGGGPEGGPLAPLGPGMTPVMNGNDGMDMKNSPANGPGTPRDEGSSIAEYNLGGFGPPENVSAEFWVEGDWVSDMQTHRSLN